MHRIILAASIAFVAATSSCDRSPGEPRAEDDTTRKQVIVLGQHSDHTGTTADQVPAIGREFLDNATSTALTCGERASEILEGARVCNDHSDCILHPCLLGRCGAAYNRNSWTAMNLKSAYTTFQVSGAKCTDTCMVLDCAMFPPESVNCVKVIGDETGLCTAEIP